MDVVNVIDGSDKFNSCLLSLELCNANKPCPLHDLAQPSRSKFIQSLNQNTIEEFSIQIEQGKVFLPL